jgi:hypothetical protein
LREARSAHHRRPAISPLATAALRRLPFVYAHKPIARMANA